MRILSPTCASIALLAFLATATVAQETAKPDQPASETTTKTEEPKKADEPNKPTDEKKTEDVKPADAKPADVKPEASTSEPAKDTEPAKEKDRKPKEKKSLPNLGSLKNPKIPGQPWRIHDLKRPRPKSVTPGAVDSLPPSDAIVLFDGQDLSQWYHLGSEDEAYEAQWNVQDGYFEIEPRTGSINTIESFGSCQLHIEWFIPEGTKGSSQGRGNSGIKFMERYEVQILDSYKNQTYADGQAGAIYGQYPPLVNAVRPQGAWQTYDIIFEAPVYEGGKIKSPPIATVLLNGVLLHHHRELTGPTGLRSGQEEVPPAGPIMLQDHGNKIRFRNVWIRPM